MISPSGDGALSRRLLLIAMLLGLAGAGLLLIYLKRFEEEVSGGRRVQLLAVVKPVTQGELITEEMLTLREVPLAYVEARAIKAADQSKVLGIRAAAALDAQDTLLWTDLAIASERRDLASLVQPGNRAVTVSASDTGSASNGLMGPGDYVDIIVTLKNDQGNAHSVVLLQRILVLAVGSETRPQAFTQGNAVGSGGSQRELTLSLKLEEAQLLSLATEKGVLSVALRGPQDTKITEGIPDMPMASLYDNVARARVQRRRTISTVSSGPVRIAEQGP